MKLINIKGNTYYIRGGTNTGVYKFNDNSVLIIDPGLAGLRPKKLATFLDGNNLDIKYIINTHEHDDHYGGCNELKKIKDGIKIFAPEDAKFFIEHPDIFGDYVIGGRGNDFLSSKRSKENDTYIEIDDIIQGDEIVLNNDKFEIIKLKGHSRGSIGILTKDKILFVGDLFVGNHILSKFSLLLLNNVKEYLESIEKIKTLDFKYMVLGHGKETISKEESYKIIENHRKVVYKYINEVRLLLGEKITIDNILKQIINNNKLSCNYKEYYFFRSSIVTIISYLVNLDEVNYEIKEGEILYYSKK